MEYEQELGHIHKQWLRFYVLTVMSIKILVLWDVMLAVCCINLKK
jgi:hypothetical protein